VVGAGSSEGDEVAARLQHAQRLAGPGFVPLLHQGALAGCDMTHLADPVEAVPFAAHELQAVGRVGDDGVHRLGGHRGHDLDAVPQVEDDVTISEEGGA
jgi:hypothetical protein